MERNKLIINYRKACLEDASRIVEINLIMWRTTYKGLIKSEIIEARFLTYNERIEKTIKQIITNNSYIVAEIDNIVIGFIQYIPSKNKKFEDYGEIQALYILDEYHGNGIGTKLFNLAILELREMGFQSIIIDCLVANSANNFYLKMGTTINSVKEELFMGGILLENIHTFNI